MIKVLNLPEKLVGSSILPLNSNKNQIIHLLNTYNLAIAHKNKEYFKLLEKSDYNFVDGKLLQIALKSRFQTTVCQIRGINLMKAILSNPQNGRRHLFICANNRTFHLLSLRMNETYPNYDCEFAVPEFTNNIDTLREDISRKIGNRSFDYIWVGIGTPKQDFLAEELSHFYQGSYILCVGAALDFFAGTKKEAPVLVQKIGMEWFFRFAQEPRRLFKRYFVDSWGFIALMLRDKIELVTD